MRESEERIYLSRRYIDFDHEVRLNVEHLNAADQKLVSETTDNNAEPKKKKFKVKSCLLINQQNVQQ